MLGVSTPLPAGVGTVDESIWFGGKCFEFRVSAEDMVEYCGVQLPNELAAVHPFGLPCNPRFQLLKAGHGEKNHLAIGDKCPTFHSKARHRNVQDLDWTFYDAGRSNAGSDSYIAPAKLAVV